jgi:Mg-chelatase subunit ChlD
MNKHASVSPAAGWGRLALVVVLIAGCTPPTILVEPQPAARATSQPGLPNISFPTGPGYPHHVVFVVDRSGSTLDVFDDVRSKVLSMVAALKYDQHFHVVFFGGRPLEMDAQNLVEASFDNKVSCAKFLGTVQPEGLTDPIQALRRAFDVLSRATRKPGKIIFLLTDGDFPDNAKVLQTIRELNADKTVVICTYRCGDRSPAAEEVLKAIARENAGRYEFLPFRNLP